MTTHDLPFGAETPDDLLFAYANGSLDETERAEVDRWLGLHPEWAARLHAYQAIGAAVRQSAAASAPPDIRSMGGLWAAIDASPQATPLRPVAPPPPPPTYLAAPPRRGGARSPVWLFAAAASLVVALVAVSAVLLSDRDSGELSVRAPSDEQTDTTEPADEGDGGSAEATPPPPATGGPGASDAAQALRDGAESTAEQDTAHTTFVAKAEVDLTGTDLADLSNTDSVTLDITGTGGVSFPDESVLDTTATFSGGLFDAIPDEHTTTVTKGDDETWISCEGGEFLPEGDAANQCTSFSFGTAFFGPDAGVSVLDNATGDVVWLGVEDIEGGPAAHYSLDIEVDRDDGGVDPAHFDVWIGEDDGLIHQLMVTADLTLPLELDSGTYDVPTHITMTYQLGRFGEPVDIPDVG